MRHGGDIADVTENVAFERAGKKHGTHVVIDVAAIDEKHTFNLSASAARAGETADTRAKAKIPSNPVFKVFNGLPLPCAADVPANSDS